MGGVLAALVAFACVGIACQGDDSEMDAEESSGGEWTTTGTTGDTGADLPFFSAEERETILSWLGPLPEQPPPDPSNAVGDDPEAVTLGRDLFYDTRYSQGGDISCATCHEPTIGFADARDNVSQGVGMSPRASIGLLNGAYGSAAEDKVIWQLWDGRTDSQWAQALLPPEGAAVMGSTRSTVVLHVYDNYRAAYEGVFGAIPALRDAQGVALVAPGLKPGVEGWDALPEASKLAVNEVFANFGKALAAYERRLISRNSRFDLFWNELSAGALDSDVLTDTEKAGLRVFIGRGRCLGCHSGPNFADNQFHNVAVPQSGPNLPETDLGRAGGVARVLGDEFNCTGPWSDHPDKTQCGVLDVVADNAEIGAFKTPTLRSVAQTAPYMHTGTFATLTDVVLHYDIGGAPNGAFDGLRDELMRPLSLESTERRDLVAFLMALDGEPLDPSLMAP